MITEVKAEKEKMTGGQKTSPCQKLRCNRQRKNPLKPSRFRGFLVGVARLKLAASASQMRRAINCATPRFIHYSLKATAFCRCLGKHRKCRPAPTQNGVSGIINFTALSAFGNFESKFKCVIIPKKHAYACFFLGLSDWT